MVVARMAQFAMIFSGGENRRENIVSFFGDVNFLPLSPLCSYRLQFSRSREFEADRIGAEIAGTPRGLASALQRIENAQRGLPMDANPATAHMFIMMPFSRRGLMSLFSTHPPTEERIRRLLA